MWVCAGNNKVEDHKADQIPLQTHSEMAIPGMLFVRKRVGQTGCPVLRHYGTLRCDFNAGCGKRQPPGGGKSGILKGPNNFARWGQGERIFWRVSLRMWQGCRR